MTKSSRSKGHANDRVTLASILSGDSRLQTPEPLVQEMFVSRTSKPTNTVRIDRPLTMKKTRKDDENKWLVDSGLVAMCRGIY